MPKKARPMNTLVIGVDIGGTRTKSGLVDIATGEVLHSIVQPTQTEDAQVFLEQTGMVIERFTALAAQKGSRLAGIGIGIPGFTDGSGNVETTYGFLKFMENYPVRSIIEREFSLSCLIDNDARVVSLGEALYGKGKGLARVLTLTLGTGVGFGLVVNGRFTDALPLAHMGGHMAVVPDGEQCYCGKKGCLEALVSSGGIIHAAEKEGMPGNPLTAEDVFAAATQHNRESIAVIGRVISLLHMAIHNYINLFAPDIIVLGGGIAKGLEPYLEKIKGDAYLSPYPGYACRLAVSALQESAGILGSAALFHLVDHTQKSIHATEK